MSLYQVKYDIIVDNSLGLKGINTFKSAISSLNASAKRLEDVRRKFVSVYDTLAGFGKKPIGITVSTGEAVAQLETLEATALRVIETLKTLQATANTPIKMATTGTGKGKGAATGATQKSKQGSGSNKQSSTSAPVTPAVQPKARPVRVASAETMAGFYKNGINPQAKQPYGHQQVHGDTPLKNQAFQQFKKLAKSHGYQPAVTGKVPQEFVQLRQWMQSPKTESRFGHQRDAAARRAESRQSRYGGVPNYVRQESNRRRVFNYQYPNAAPGEYEKWARDMKRGVGPAQPKMNPVPPARAHSEMLKLPKSTSKNSNSSSYRSYRNSYGGNYQGNTGYYRGAAPYSSNFNRYGGLTYKMLGPTPLPNNGGMAMDMLKGMGIAYGISAVGSLVSSIVDQATSYDNLMTTVSNILKSHDGQTNFYGRFANMKRTVRDVGMETKYTVTEVADAAKFLAMAGLDVDAISTAIRPIADIALVGDTGLGETADLVTNIMTAYNIAPGRMRNAADIMTNTFTMSNTTLPEIAEAYKYAASLLSEGGVDFAEATAAIGILGDAGIKSSQAGTTLRTIMANIVNPTKKQKAAWERIGVKRYDKDGNRRSLVDIFKDLKATDLEVADYYQLFHKTAASGAAALTTHSDKWQNVINENLISGGLSGKLAEAKKNTIQGLWAQVKSILVDRGVSAFEGVDGGIRGLMRSAIDFMGGNDTPENTAKGERFRSMMSSLASTVMEFVNTMIEATKWFFKLYSWFAPMIKVWMRFQLAIWPVTKALGALSTVRNGLLWLKTIPDRFRNLANSIRAVTVATNENTAANAANANSGKAMAASAPAAYSTKLRGWKLKQQMYMPTTYDPNTGSFRDPEWRDTGKTGWGMMWNKAKAAGRGAGNLFKHPIRTLREFPYKDTFKTVGRGIGGGLNFLDRTGANMIMGGLGAYKAMEQATDEEGSSLAAWLYGGAAVASMMGPWGIGIGAIMGIGGMIAEHYHKVELAKQAAERIAAIGNQYVVQDGMLIDKYANDATKYLDTIYAKNRDINEELRLRIQQTRELLGLESTPKVDDSNGSTNTFSQLFEDAAAKYGTSSETIKAVNGLSSQLLDVTGVGIKEENGKYYLAYADQNGSGYQEVSGLQAIGNLAMVIEAATGESTKQMREEWNQAIARAFLSGSPEALNRVIDEFNKQVGNYDLSKIDAHQDYTVDQWKGLAGKPKEFWKFDLPKMARANILREQLKIDSLPTLFENFKDAKAADSTNLWQSYTQIHPFIGQGGFPLEGDWLKNIGWNGTNFMAVKDGLVTNIPQDTEQLYLTYGLLKQEIDKANQMGLSHSKDSSVVENLNRMKELKDYVAGLIVMSNPEYAKTYGVVKPDNWAIKDGAIYAKDYNWFQYNNGQEQLYTLPSTVTTANRLAPVSMPFAPTQWGTNWLNGPYGKQWIKGITSINSGTAGLFGTSNWFNSNLWANLPSPYIVTPSNLPASQPIAIASATPPVSPTINIHIDTVARVENMSVNNDSDEKTLGEKIANELGQIITTASQPQNVNRWARVGGCI